MKANFRQFIFEMSLGGVFEELFSKDLIKIPRKIRCLVYLFSLFFPNSNYEANGTQVT